MRNSLSETSANRYYWELVNKPGFYWSGRKKKAVTDPKKRSEYKCVESARKYAPPDPNRWEMKHYQLWVKTTEYTSRKTVI